MNFEPSDGVVAMNRFDSICHAAETSYGMPNRRRQILTSGRAEVAKDW